MAKSTGESLRPITITRRFTDYAEGSVLFEAGRTRVLCNASISDGVPAFRRGSGEGWITAEYSMLPRATVSRSPRESVKGKQSGRTIEISRLIGRSLRAAVDLSLLGERTITFDCDVLQADGGTRCASISGSMIALVDAISTLQLNGSLSKDINPVKCLVAAVSVGLVDGKPTLDLCYEEDSSAEVDMNVVMTEDGRFVEFQGTAEKEPFSEDQLAQLKALAVKGCLGLIKKQRAALRCPLHKK